MNIGKGLTESKIITIVIIALVVLLLFGGKKIPELMRGIGSGVRSFKEGLNDVKSEVEKPLNKKEDEEK